MTLEERLKNNEFSSVAAYVKAAYELAVTYPEKSTESHKANDADMRFKAALNRYLESENCELPAVSDDAKLPDDMAQRVSSALDYEKLFNVDNIFNIGSDHLQRTASRERLAAMAALYKALSDYMSETDMPPMFKDNKREIRPFTKEEQSPQHRKPKLYKQSVELRDDGSDKRDMKPVEAIDNTRRYIIVFGGVNTFHANKGEMRGITKLAESMVGGKAQYIDQEDRPDVDYYCLAYPVEHRVTLASYAVHYNADPENYFIPYAQDVFDCYFRTALQEAVEKDHEANGLANSKAALRQINLFCFSHGSVFAKSLCNVMTQFYEEHDYTQAQIKALLPEVFSLHINPTARIDDEKPCGNFSALYCVNDVDRCARARANHHRIMEGNTDTPQMVEISDNELMLWTHRPNVGVIKDTINQAFDYRDGKKTPSAQKGNVVEKSGHAVKLMAYGIYEGDIENLGDPHRIFYERPKAMVNALRNALANKIERWNVKEMVSTSVNLFQSRYPDAIRFRVRPTHAELEATKRSAANENMHER